jgi:hypothetical protein
MSSKRGHSRLEDEEKENAKAFIRYMFMTIVVLAAIGGLVVGSIACSKAYSIHTEGQSVSKHFFTSNITQNSINKNTSPDTYLAINFVEDDGVISFSCSGFSVLNTTTANGPTILTTESVPDKYLSYAYENQTLAIDSPHFIIGLTNNGGTVLQGTVYIASDGIIHFGVDYFQVVSGFNGVVHFNAFSGSYLKIISQGAAA